MEYDEDRRMRMGRKRRRDGEWTGKDRNKALGLRKREKGKPRMTSE